MPYVYLHLKADNGEVFYVGYGGDNKYHKRANDRHTRNKFWLHIYKKHGRIVQIYKDGITEAEGKKIEAELIQKYGRRDQGRGTLVNLTDGGDGMNNYKMSEETRRKIGNFWRGKKIPYRPVPNRRKPVIYLKDGTIFETLGKMCDHLGINSKSQLNAYKHKHPGLKFEYYDKQKYRELNNA